MNFLTMPHPVMSTPASPTTHKAAPQAAGGHPFATLMQHAQQTPKTIQSHLNGMARNFSAQAAMNRAH
jgi:hypothetical protein